MLPRPTHLELAPPELIARNEAGITGWKSPSLASSHIIRNTRGPFVGTPLS